MPASVLYVDDDRGLCQIVAKALGSEGYVLRTCFDGESAVAAIKDDPPDLVLLDVLLPRRDGFEVLEEIRRLPGSLAQLPVILISGCTPTPAYAERANALGALALLSKPVPLEKLLDAVVEHLGEPKAEASVGPSAEPRRTDAISGSFDRIPFPAVLHHLHGLRATGVLHLVSGKKRKWVQLREGYPVAVRSNLVKETLGHFLVRKGHIGRAIVDEVNQHRKKQGRKQGEVLVAMDLLSEEQVAAALRSQADEKLFEVFRWKSGTFRFERGAGLQRANVLGLGRSPANLILQGVRTHFPIARIDRYLQTHARRYVAHGESPFYRFQDLHLDEAQEALLRGIDGTQCLEAFQREDESLRRTVYGLIATGFLELRGSSAGAAKGPKQTGVAAPKAERSPKRAAAPPGPVGATSAQPPSARDEEAQRAELAELAEQLRARNHFEILGVAPTDGDAEIRAAYERMASRAHPDRFAGGSQSLRDLAADVYGLVRSAYDTLSNPRGRQEYLLAQQKKARRAKNRRQSEIAFEAESEFRRGEEALRGRAYEKALQHFGRALELYPDEGDHHAHYGWALYLCHPEESAIVAEALEHVKRGLKLASHKEKAYLFMGRLLKAVGRVDQAERMFSRAAQIQPECVDALRELRIINMRREKSKGLIGRLLRR
jgi:CheY-like chemotaxis protein/curved DNA-binding protein CbpA